MNQELKQAAIVGGKGKEGKRWEKILSSQGWTVHIVDRNDPVWIIECCSLVVLAISWRAIKEMRDVIDHIKPGAVCVSAMGRMSKKAFELKGRDGEGTLYLCDLLLRKKVELAFVHFMYASHMEDGSKQNAAIDDSRCSLSNSQMVCALVAKTNATLVPVERERHDKITAFTQRMMREFALMFAHAAIAENITFQEMYSLSTPPFRAFLAMVCRVLLQPRQLNEEIVLDLQDIPATTSALVTIKYLACKKRQEERGLGEASASKEFGEFFIKTQRFVKSDLAAELAVALV
ncbi:MAG: hypothetical protein WC761_06105 [Candidatus Paceibacterota bacterium]|jgi:prephenate dehydrogenase